MSVSRQAAGTTGKLVVAAATVGLLIFGVVLLLAAASLDTAGPGDDAARLQALAAGGTLLATVVLVLVTGLYVKLTGDAVEQARQARLDSVRPALAIRADAIGPTNIVFALVSVGQGTALDLDLSITFGAANAGGHSHEVAWRSPSLSPGDSARFMPRDAAGNVVLGVEDVPAAFKSVHVEGTMRDAAGNAHPVLVEMNDLAGWKELLVSAGQQHREPPLDRIAKSVEKLAKK